MKNNLIVKICVFFLVVCVVGAGISFYIRNDQIGKQQPVNVPSKPEGDDPPVILTPEQFESEVDAEGYKDFVSICENLEQNGYICVANQNTKDSEDKYLFSFGIRNNVSLEDVDSTPTVVLLISPAMNPSKDYYLVFDLREFDVSAFYTIQLHYDEVGSLSDIQQGGTLGSILAGGTHEEEVVNFYHIPGENNYFLFYFLYSSDISSLPGYNEGTGTVSASYFRENAQFALYCK